MKSRELNLIERKYPLPFHPFKDWGITASLIFVVGLTLFLIWLIVPALQYGGALGANLANVLGAMVGVVLTIGGALWIGSSESKSALKGLLLLADLRAEKFKTQLQRTIDLASKKTLTIWADHDSVVLDWSKDGVNEIRATGARALEFEDSILAIRGQLGRRSSVAFIKKMFSILNVIENIADIGRWDNVAVRRELDPEFIHDNWDYHGNRYFEHVHLHLKNDYRAAMLELLGSSAISLLHDIYKDENNREKYEHQTCNLRLAIIQRWRSSSAENKKRQNEKLKELDELYRKCRAKHHFLYRIFKDLRGNGKQR